MAEVCILSVFLYLQCDLVLSITKKGNKNAYEPINSWLKKFEKEKLWGWVKLKNFSQRRFLTYFNSYLISTYPLTTWFYLYGLIATFANLAIMNIDFVNIIEMTMVRILSCLNQTLPATENISLRQKLHPDLVIQLFSGKMERRCDNDIYEWITFYFSSHHITVHKIVNPCLFSNKKAFPFIMNSSVLSVSNSSWVHSSWVHAH